MTRRQASLLLLSCFGGLIALWGLAKVGQILMAILFPLLIIGGVGIALKLSSLRGRRFARVGAGEAVLLEEGRAGFSLQDRGQQPGSRTKVTLTNRRLLLESTGNRGGFAAELMLADIVSATVRRNANAEPQLRVTTRLAELPSFTLDVPDADRWQACLKGQGVAVRKLVKNTQPLLPGQEA